MNFRKPTGLCAACGRSTALLVHQGCGELMRQKRPAPRRLARRDINWLAKRGATA